MRYIKIFLKKKNKKNWEYGFECYQNLWEDEKQKLVEYRKNIIEWEKMLYYNHKKLLFKKNGLESSFDEEYKDVLKL